MDQLQHQLNKLKAPKLIKNLNNRHYDAYYADNKQEAIDLALSFIDHSHTISWGGSKTLEQLELLDYFRLNDYQVIDRDQALNQEEKIMMMRESLLVDTYFTSVNAIADDGIMVNIDGTGNRIAAMAFGPKQVVIIVSMNKLVTNLEQAVDRAREVVAPINSLRLNRPLPCTQTGVCHNCLNEQSICSQIVIYRHNAIKNRIKIIVLNDSLGM